MYWGFFPLYCSKKRPLCGSSASNRSNSLWINGMGSACHRRCGQPAAFGWKAAEGDRLSWGWGQRGGTWLPGGPLQATVNAVQCFPSTPRSPPRGDASPKS